MRNNPTNARVREEGGAPGRYSLAARGRDHSGANMHTAARGGLHVRADGYSLKEAAACAGLCRSRFILKDCSLWEGRTLEQGKSVRRKEQQRGAVTD